MTMRITGMNSGLDTESIIQELVAAKRTKVDDMKKQQTKLEWKQDIWKELNSKIKKFYNSTLDNLRFQSSYTKKVTTVSNSSVASVITADSAMNSVQKLKVDKLAQTGYLTGGIVKKADGSKCTSGTKLTDMGIEAGSGIEITAGGKTTEIAVTESMTISGLTSALNNAGVNANFDSKTQRFFIGAKGSGEQADFAITASNGQGETALDKLGILVYDAGSMKQYEAYAALRTDADGYQAAIDKEVAARLKSYLSQSESLQKSISDQQEAMQKIKDAYAEDVGTDDFDALVNNTDGALDTLKADIKALEEKEDRTEEENAELNKLKGKLSYIEGYHTAEEKLTKTQGQLAEAQSYFNADDNTASDKLVNEVTTWLEDKIAQAEAAVSGSKTGTADATKVAGQDAKIYLNNAEFISTDNTFEINGLTITCNAETNGEEVTLTTQNDTSGIYDMIKNFITEYSSLINEMDKLYNADAAKGYEPLTDEEKDAMSEKEVEKWEEKIKDSLLRRDSTLNTVSSAFREIMASGFTVGGKTMYLSDFGIETLGYFEAEDNERNAYHIFGDEDDSAVSSKTNELKAMISADPDKVMDFFSQLTKKLYEKTTDLMASVKDYSSAFTVYEDKKMKSDYDEYTKKIAELETKLTSYEDKWYQKFSAMETALAKMQSNASAITGLLGG